MKKIKFILPLLAILVVFASCTKSDRIANRMKAKKGEWIIAEYSTKSDFFGNETYIDAGEMIFKENAYIMILNIKGESYSESGEWRVLPKKVTLIVDGNMSDYDIISSSRKEMTLSCTQSYYDYYGDESATETTIIRLRRK